MEQARRKTSFPAKSNHLEQALQPAQFYCRGIKKMLIIFSIVERNSNFLDCPIALIPSCLKSCALSFMVLQAMNLSEVERV